MSGCEIPPWVVPTSHPNPQLVYLKRLERNMRHVSVCVGALICHNLNDYLCPSSNSVGYARWLADVGVCVC